MFDIRIRLQAALEIEKFEFEIMSHGRSVSKTAVLEEDLELQRHADWFDEDGETLGQAFGNCIW